MAPAEDEQKPRWEDVVGTPTLEKLFHLSVSDVSARTELVRRLFDFEAAHYGQPDYEHLMITELGVRPVRYVTMLYAIATTRAALEHDPRMAAMINLRRAIKRDARDDRYSPRHAR